MVDLAHKQQGQSLVNIQELELTCLPSQAIKAYLASRERGGLFVRSDLDLQPLREGGNGSHSNSLEQPTERPERYESGTPNMIGLAGLLAGVEYLLETGVENIRTTNSNKSLIDESARKYQWR